MSTTIESTDLVPVPRIVVGVDGSPQSLLALRWAARYAADINGSVEAVTAWRVATTWELPYGWDAQKEASETLDRALTEVFGGQPPPSVVHTVLPGTAAQVLLTVAKDAAMLVVGSRGHGGFVGMLLGSVSSAVAEHAPCPVLIVHGDLAGLPLKW